MISYLGQFDGRAVILFGWDIVVAVFSLAIFYTAQFVGISPAQVAQCVEADGRESARDDDQALIIG